MKLTLTYEGAQALREFAEAIPLAIENIRNETDALQNVYRSVSDRLGSHNQDFVDLLTHIQNAQKRAAEAISELPPKMLATAEKIEAYVAAHPTLN
jgi:DNA anti-recombination protein RmuC